MLMSRNHVFCLLCFVAFLSLSALAQDFPTVKYSQELWSLNPPSYSIKADTTGNARYESTPNSADQTGQNYTQDFSMSDATKNKIFNALQALNFFNKTIDDVVPGDGGTRTLMYSYGGNQTVATYHATSNPTAQQLTKLFQSISITMETGRRLDKLHQSKDPALGDVVSRMLTRAQAGELAELQAIMPILQSISSDNSVAQTIRNQVNAVIKIAVTST